MIWLEVGALGNNLNKTWRERTSGLEGSNCHKKCSTIPTDLVETFEFLSNFGNGRSHNGLVRSCQIVNVGHGDALDSPYLKLIRRLT